MGQLEGRVAIVTGSGRGIGQQIALRLAREGARIVVNDLDEAPAKETIALIEKAGGKAVACNGDVSAKDFGPRVVKTAVDTFGDCHILVNNAGYTWDSVIQKMTDDQWEAIIGLHLSAPFRIMRAFLRPSEGCDRCGKEERRADRAQGREYFLDIWRERKCRSGELFVRQGRYHRPDKGDLQRVGPLRRHRQCGGFWTSFRPG